MKIVIVDTTLQGPLIGGAQTFLPSLLKGFNVRGHEVHLVTNGQPDQRLEKQISQCGAIVHTNLWNNKMLVEDAAKKLANWVNKLQPDIYVVSVSWDIAWLTLPYLDPGIATYTVAHSNNNAFYFPAKHYKNFLTEVIGVSHEICQKYQTVSGIDSDNIHWIPYGISPSAFLPERMNNSELNLIFVGRLEEADKRISDVAEIIKKLEEAKINYHFRIIGDGSRLDYLKAELSAETMAEKVEMPGWLKSEEVLQLLQQSDIFILCSSSEGFSISLIEAMANGCCPVVTDIPSGSVQLISSDINGYLLPVGDIEGFAKKLVYLSEQPELLQKMRYAAWETGRKFSIDKMTDTYLDIFKNGKAKANKTIRAANPGFPVMDSCKSKYPKWLRTLKNQISG